MKHDIMVEGTSVRSHPSIMKNYRQSMLLREGELSFSREEFLHRLSWEHAYMSHKDELNILYIYRLVS